MSRGAQSFKQGDITKAIKGAVKAGFKVGRFEIEDGKIVVFAGDVRNCVRVALLTKRLRPCRILRWVK